MVTFDSRMPGTAAETWAGDARFTTLPVLSLAEAGEVVVFAAHPDDETLGAGGLLAAASAAGIPVRVIIVTDGGASHPHSPSISAVHLAVLRRLEVSKAIEVLAPLAELVFLDFEDGSIIDSRAQVSAEVRSILDRAPTSALIVCPWRGDRHRDHRVLGEICAEAVDLSGHDLLEYPIWMWHWAVPDSPEIPWDKFVGLPLQTREAELKHAAVRMHHSQIAPLSAEPGDEVVLNDKFLRHFDLGVEVFIATPFAEHHTAGPPQTASESPSGATLGRQYFESTYARQDDPWGFMSRWYEQRKRAITMASLARERYRSVFEIGSSIGMLTELLAARSDRVLAVDVSQSAVDRSRLRLARYPQVCVEQMDVAEAYPSGEFDLVVLSEVGYYFSADDLDGLLRRIEQSLTPEGTLLLCHWRHPVADYPLTGSEVHAAAESLKLTRITQHIEKDFIVDIYTTDGLSVAEQTELI